MFLSETFVQLKCSDAVSEFNNYEFLDVSLQEPPAKTKTSAKNKINNVDLPNKGEVFSDDDCAFKSTESGFESDVSNEAASECEQEFCDVCFSETTNKKRRIRPSLNISNDSGLHSKSSSRSSNMSPQSSRPVSILPRVNIEEFKDANYKLEEFDKTTERKWTFSYGYNKEEETYKLNKIIIGRGQKNEYPEFNSVLLYHEVANYHTSSWRNNLIGQLQERKRTQTTPFSLLPTPATCKNCFKDRTKHVRSRLLSGLTLQTVDDSSYASVASCKQPVQQKPVDESWKSTILTQLQMNNCRSFYAGITYERHLHEARVKREKKKKKLKWKFFKIKKLKKKQKESTVESEKVWEDYDVV